MQKEANFIAFTDGSAVVKGSCTCEKETCPRCQQLGGWGVYLIGPNGTEKGYQRGYKGTKTGRMELMAFLYAIKRMRKDKPANLTIYSDSSYTVNLIAEKWLQKWQMIDFLGKANIDLLKQIIQAIAERPFLTLKVKHIKGHQTNTENELVFGNNVADALASYKEQKEFYVDKF